MRSFFQAVFLAITLVGVFVVQGNAERWCPFGGVEALYTYIAEGNMTCSLAVSNFYILAAVLAITLLLRRAFCGYMCPIGTISDWLGRGAAAVGLKPRTVRPGLDKWLGLLKYAVLFVVLFLTYRASELIFRGFDPCYALISRHGEDITKWAYVIAGAIVVGSLVVTMPFCRWLCPLAAVLSPFSRFGLVRVRRDAEACVDCGKCSAACPMGIPVDSVKEVTQARCMSCLDCVDVCPRRDEGAVTWGPPKRWGKPWSKAALAAILVVCTTVAVVASYAFPLPSFIKTRGTEPADTAVVMLNVEGVTCRGSSNLLVYYLERDDVFALVGYLKVEAWPGPGYAPVHVTFDPSRCDEDMIRQAVTEPYYDALADVWRPSPFVIAGYDALGLDDDGS